MLALGLIAVITSFGKAALHRLVGTVRSMAFGGGQFHQLATGAAGSPEDDMPQSHTSGHRDKVSSGVSWSSIGAWVIARVGNSRTSQLWGLPSLESPTTSVSWPGSWTCWN